MEDLFMSISAKKSLAEITSLNLSKNNLLCLDISTLNKCSNLLSLDVSQNRIKSLVDIDLPVLRSLNFEDNCISDVTFLSGVPSVEELYIDGNPINAADRYIALDLLPNIVALDGRSCGNMQNNIKQFENRLVSQADLTLKTKYEPIFKSCSDLNEFIQCQKQFTREVLNKVSSCSVPPKFQRFKVQTSIEILLKDTLKMMSFNRTKNTKVGSSKSAPSTPVKETSARCPVRESPRKKKVVTVAPPVKKLSSEQPTNGHEVDIGRSPFSSERKRKYQLDLEATSSLSYNPHLFLRCHSISNDPQDSTTSIWAAAFEPDPSYPGRTLETVATCGGPTVCFINCETGHVLKRYSIDSSSSENLYALDWSVVKVAGCGNQKATVLATGGLEKKIYLIHPLQLKCYYIFKAHTLAINCLQFHPIETTWLFSGSRDRTINLWDIGHLSLPEYKVSVQKVMTLETEGEVVQILVSPKYSCLIASSTKGLAVWNLNGDESQWKRKPSVTLVMPDSLKTEESDLVDGLSFVSENCIACKVSCSGKIFLWDLTFIFTTSGQLTRKRLFEISPSAIFLWSDGDSEYNYIGSCIEKSVICCGDNAGRLWVYDVQKYTKQQSVDSFESSFELPAIVLQWPQLQFEGDEFHVRQKIIVNSVKFNWNGNYLVACTDSNLVCVWKMS